MDDKRLKVLKQAILNEIEGYEFYKMYAGRVSSDEVREIFMSIANEELSHIDYLKSLMNKDETKEMDLSKIEIPSPGVFKFNNMTPDDLTLALSAFNIGVMMEEDSQKFYREEANKFEEEDIKALFLKLADWETQHRDQFKEQYELFKEEWWGDNNFAAY